MLCFSTIWSKEVNKPFMYMRLNEQTRCLCHVLNTASVIDGRNYLFFTMGASNDNLLISKDSLNCFHIFKE